MYPRWLCTKDHKEAGGVQEICRWQDQEPRAPRDRACLSTSVLHREMQSVHLCRLHIKSFTETCKDQWLINRPGGFGCRNVILDLFVIRPPRGEQRKWCLGTGTCVMGNQFTNREQCRWHGQRVAVSRWADQSQADVALPARPLGPDD